MKRTFYILSFTFLGILLSFLVHALVEIPVIRLLVGDFEKWGLGLSWDSWFAVHNAFAIVLFALGVYLGYRQGVYWWNTLYVERGGRCGIFYRVFGK